MELWEYARLKRGIPLSVLLSDGEDWYRMRRAIDKQLLTLPNVYKYIEPMNGVADDFIKLFLNKDNNRLSLKVSKQAAAFIDVTRCGFAYERLVG